MKESRFTIEKKKLDLLYPWKISRGSTLFKENFFVQMNNGDFVGMGEVAPNTRYGENPEKIVQDFQKFQGAYKNEDLNFEEFSEFLERLKIANSLRFGIESAYVHARLQEKQNSVHSYFGQGIPKAIHTSFSIPIMEIGELKNFVPKFARYQFLKIKVDAQTGLETIKMVSSLTNQTLRIDANEGWTDFDDFMKFLNEIKKVNIELIEQPFPADKESEYEALKKKSPYPVIADESVTDTCDFDKIEKQFHGINVKLMKAGGYINGVRLLQEAKKRNLKTMLGCMIETTLGISSAMEISSLADYVDLDGFLHLKEDPYQFVEERHGQLFLSKN